MSALQITSLRKTYANGVVALRDVNLRIGQGMFGLLGPNGAGKSTLMRTVATLQRADGGSIDFRGVDVMTDRMALRRQLGYLPQEFGVYPKVSADRLLHYFARLKGLGSKRDRQQAIDRVLEITNLTGARRQHVSTYSGGMRQRFGIAQLLLNHPSLIIVDEPTAGLDPAERNRFLDILRAVSTESTVIFSTHIVDDVRELCTDMAIMNEGRILLQSAPTTATANLAGTIWTADSSVTAIDKLPPGTRMLSSRYLDSATVRLRVHAERAPGTNYRTATPDLEDVYFLALN